MTLNVNQIHLKKQYQNEFRVEGKFKEVFLVNDTQKLLVLTQKKSAHHCLTNSQVYFSFIHIKINALLLLLLLLGHIVFLAGYVYDEYRH